MRAKALIVLFALAAFANASTINNINLWIQEDGYGLVEQKITLEKSSYSIRIPHSSRDIAVFSKRGPLKYNVSGKDREILSFSLKKPLAEGEIEEVWVKYGTHGLTSKRGGVWHITYSSQATPRQTVVRVNFPVGTQILTLEPSTLLRTPEESAYVLYPWEADFSFNMSYQYRPTPTSTLAPAQNNTQQKDDEGLIIGKTEFYIMFALLFIVLFAVLWVIVRKRQETGQEITFTPENGVTDSFVTSQPSVGEVSSNTNMEGEIKESVINMLDETEAEIVRFLDKSEEEEITQAYIYKTTGMPKSTLSEKLKQLEKRKIIYRTKEGRTNWIKLQEWIFY